MYKNTFDLNSSLYIFKIYNKATNTILKYLYNNNSKKVIKFIQKLCIRFTSKKYGTHL